jgi:tRNA(adenine34) deaminase
MSVLWPWRLSSGPLAQLAFTEPRDRFVIPRPRSSHVDEVPQAPDFPGKGGPRKPVASDAVDLGAAMELALDEAALAAAHDDVPVGAVVLRDGEVIAQRHNERERTGDPTAHAELLALRDAAEEVGSWRLEGTTLVVTLEPCPMCAGALVAARVDQVVFGVADPKTGACGSLYNLAVDPRLNHEVKVVSGVRAEEAALLLTGFFEERRGAGQAD